MATNVSTIAAVRPANAGWRRFWLLLQANMIMYVREKTAMFWVVIFPIGLMLLFGSIYGNIKINPTDPNSLTVISFMVPGLIVLALMSNGLIGNASEMATYRERGVLRRIQTTPLPVWQLIFARIIMQSAIMVGQSALMVGISIIVFNAKYDAWGLVSAIPWVVLGAIVFMAMGQAIAAVVRKASTVNIVAQVINLPLMFLGGLWMPLDQLPEALQTVGKYLPSAIMADLVRTPMLASFSIDTSLPMALGVAIISVYFAGSVFISARFFKWS